MLEFKIPVEDLTGEIDEFKKGYVSFLLKLPVGMSYELWCCLHKVKGDWIE